jgi:hypothetical protein
VVVGEEGATPSLIDRPFGVYEDAVEIEEDGGEAHGVGMVAGAFVGKCERWVGEGKGG